MVGTDDVQRYSQKFQNQWERVQTADIDERDREAILAFVRALDATDEVNEGTLGARLNHLRLSAERADVPLVEMDRSDVDDLLFALKHEYDLSQGTRRNYRKSLRRFFLHRDREWAEDFSVGAPPDRSVDPDELLTDEEITALIDTPENPRDKAMVALLADTGLRVGAIASLRVRDVSFEGPTATVTINEDANVKDASGTVPLTWSEGYVASWLDVHPRRDASDAALIHKHGGYHADGDDGALNYQYLSRRVKEIADAAGIDRGRVNTHNFRKTAISRWIREGLSEQAIKHRATWTVDSEQLATYSGVRDEELNDQILAHYDIATSDEGADRPDLEACPRCGTALRTADEYCPSCGAALTDRAADRLEDTRDDVLELLVEATDTETRQQLRTLLAEIDGAPDAVHGSSSSE